MDWNLEMRILEVYTKHHVPFPDGSQDQKYHRHLKLGELLRDDSSITSLHPSDASCTRTACRHNLIHDSRPLPGILSPAFCPLFLVLPDP